MDKAHLSNCFYCDTDSIILNKKGLKNLVSTLHPDKLGLLKIEGEARRVILRGAKHYTFGSDVKCKGIKKRHETKQRWIIYLSIFSRDYFRIAAWDHGRLSNRITN